VVFRAVTALMLALPTAVPAGNAVADEVPRSIGEEGRTAVCHVPTYTVPMAPGLTMLPVENTFGTTEPTAIACDGSVRGRPGDGPRDTGLHREGDGAGGGGTCEVFTGHGRAVITLPTAEGAVELVNNFTFEGGGAAGQFTGDVFSGVVHLSPVQGDCVTEPLTVLAIRVLTGVIRN
jgi:hypothetical protein